MLWHARCCSKCIISFNPYTTLWDKKCWVPHFTEGELKAQRYCVNCLWHSAKSGQSWDSKPSSLGLKSLVQNRLHCTDVAPGVLPRPRGTLLSTPGLLVQDTCDPDCGLISWLHEKHRPQVGRLGSAGKLIPLEAALSHKWREQVDSSASCP